jgi:hypothetical protein
MKSISPKKLKLLKESGRQLITDIISTSPLDQEHEADCLAKFVPGQSFPFCCKERKFRELKKKNKNQFHNYIES